MVPTRVVAAKMATTPATSCAALNEAAFMAVPTPAEIWASIRWRRGSVMPGGGSTWVTKTFEKSFALRVKLVHQCTTGVCRCACSSKLNCCRAARNRE